MINVTKTYLPDLKDYISYLEKIWDSGWVTNNGPIVQELESKIKEYLGVKHLLYCNNGTIVLQMAIKALGITKEVITTPYSYVATTNAILWENCTPVFVDINLTDFNIDPELIESAITENTQAILTTHVYGNPCDDNAIRTIANKYGLKIIYDGAHAFGSRINSGQILNLGDISTCSLHATKLFHTIEGGLLITNDDELFDKLTLYRQFGHIYDEFYSIGINAKGSEFHAAMGLCNLPKLPQIMAHRRTASSLYELHLNGLPIQRPQIKKDLDYNYAYFPVVFRDIETQIAVKKALEDGKVFARRYFYPSLNTLPFLKIKQSCPNSESIAERVLCLPLSHDITDTDISYICNIIKKNAIKC